MHRKLALALTAVVLTAGIATAQNAPADPSPASVRQGRYVLDKAHAKINWAVSHFGFSTYTGEFTAFDAQLQLDPRDPARSSLRVTIDTRSIETNNDALDTHLRSAEFFDAARFPEATFVSTRVAPTGPRSADVTGNLTLKGVTKPVTLAVTFNGAGINPASQAYVAGFSARTTIRRTDFGVSAYAPAVGDTVALTIEGEFNPAP